MLSASSPSTELRSAARSVIARRVLFASIWELRGMRLIIEYDRTVFLTRRREQQMRWRRLGWAGLELEADGETLVVDHLLDPGILGHFYGEERDPLITPDAGKARAALVTHLHRDHTDPAAIEAALSPSGEVLRPWRKPAESRLDEVATGESERELEERGLPARQANPGDTFEAGPFAITALFASDGLGSPQVSWLIETGGTRVLHAGDTLWHGGWWDVPAAHGRIDLAFLPGNGVEISYPGWEPHAAVPAVMTPEQSIEAAYALGAGTLVPIHYNRTFEHPEFYRPVTDAPERIAASAANRGVDVTFAEPGSWYEVGAS